MIPWRSFCGYLFTTYGKLLTNPSNDTQLELGDELVIIGTREQLRVVEGTI